MWQTVIKGHRAIVIGCLVLACTVAITLSLLQPEIANAQDVSPDALRALQQRGAGGTNYAEPDNKPTIQTYRPVQPQQANTSPSHLEAIYSAKSGRSLRQVGYDALGAPATISIMQAGAVQDRYVLGIGDELLFQLRGQENSSYRQRVDRNGRIVLPKLNPIPAAGRTLADFREALESEVNRAYLSTKVYVSLGETREVSVLVTGYVQTPGMRILGAMASPVDAILLSGGISKSGSLRNIQLIRNGTVRVIDLYSLLLKGGPIDMGMLLDGDRIYVAPLGQTVAIAGSVRTQGIYELPVGASAISATALISLAGGTLVANSYDISKSMLDRDGTTRLIPIPKGSAIRSGEIVFVDPSRQADMDRVVLGGAVELPGLRPLSVASGTSELFHSATELLPAAYAPFALIVRRDPRSNAVSLIPFSIIRALSHTADIPLQSNDSVYVFTLSDIRALTRVVTRDANVPYVPSSNGGTGGTWDNGAGRTAPGGGSVRGSRSDGDASSNGGQAPPAQLPSNAPPVVGGASAAANGAGLDLRNRNGQAANSSEGTALAESQALIRSETGADLPGSANPAESDDEIADSIATTMGVPPEMLRHAISDRLVWVLDQVGVPGVYVAAEGTTLPEIIDAAGGPQTQADLSAVEVTSTAFDRLAGASRTTRNTYVASDSNFRTTPIKPLDVVRLRQVYADRTGETVTIAGQVRYPGVYDILRDERLSSVLQRAGGITEVGYPYGTIFTRRSAAVHEREGNMRAARELSSQLATLVASSTQMTTGQTGSENYLTGLIDEVRDAPTLGRISVTADPVVLASKPNLDVLLEPGDAIYIPKRPTSVAVTGEVLNPGSFQFRTGLSFEDYIRLAGGATPTAYESAAFVVLPDGSAVPMEDGWFSFGSGGHIPPGSTIVVPRDLRPFDWSQFLKDATQIVSQLAISAASLAVLQNNN